MISKCSAKVVSYLVENRIIKADDQEIYLFGFTSILIHIIHVVCMIVIGMMLRRTVEAAEMIIVYSAIRTTAGGQHFQNKKLCFMTSCFLVLFLVGPLNLFPIKVLMIYAEVMLFPSVVLIYWLAPCDNIKKRMNGEEKIKYKTQTRMLLLIFIIVAIFGFYMHLVVSYIISVCMFAEAIGLIWGTAQNKCLERGKSNNN